MTVPDDRTREFQVRILGWLKGDVDAAALCMNLIYVAHLWDDLIDRDKERADAEINMAFRIALFDIPANPFYVKFSRLLQPQILSVILQYEAANVLERQGNAGQKGAAYAMRNAVLHVVGTCIYAVGGQEWYDTASVEFYEFLSENTEEEFRFFLKEMDHA